MTRLSMMEVKRSEMHHTDMTHNSGRMIEIVMFFVAFCIEG